MSEKQAWIARARKVLESYRKRLDEVKAQAVRADEPARWTYRLHIGELQSRLTALQNGMKELEARQDESWTLLKESVENASREFDSRLAGIL